MLLNVIKERATEHERTLATLYGARGRATFLLGVRPPDQESLALLRQRHRLTPLSCCRKGGAGTRSS